MAVADDDFTVARRFGLGLHDVLRLAAVVVGITLLWSGLGAAALSADEQFSGVHARLPVMVLWRELIRNDTHPPLDYLVRKLVVGPSDAFWLRVPSAMVATATLLSISWWMRRRGHFGLTVTVISSVLPFFLLYGRTARMYALLILFGVFIAWLATAWLQCPGRRLSAGLAVVLTLALFTDGTAVLLVVGALAIPGLRRDRSAWWWRASTAAPAALWLLVWGRNIPSQLRSGQASWIPRTTPASVTDQVGRLISLVHPELGIIAMVAMGTGALLLVRQDRHLGRVVVCLGALPVVLTVTAGIWAHVLLARSLAVASVSAVLTLAAVIEEARRRNVRTLTVVLAVVCVLLVPSIGPAHSFEEETGPAMRALTSRSQAGDVVVLSPASLGQLFEWSLDAPSTSAVIAGFEDRSVVVHRRSGGPATGRAWVLAHGNRPWRPSGGSDCPDEAAPALIDYTLRCYVIASA